MIKTDTKIYSIYDTDRDKDAIQAAAEIIQMGGTVIFPTETVYGLGADALNPEAVVKIFNAKGRPADNPLISHISDLDDLFKLTSNTTPEALTLAKYFWPGPLTMILPKNDIVPDVVTAGLDSVAVRMPSNPVAKALIQAAGTPIAAPSANLSGKPSPTEFSHCYNDMNGRVDAIIESYPCEVGVESTVISLCSDVPVILRPGFITPEQIENVIGRVIIDKGVTEHISDSQKVMSPGMKYKHYSPDADVILLKGNSVNFTNYIISHADSDSSCAICFSEDVDIPVRSFSYGASNDHAAQAARIFSLLREIDTMGFKTVYVHCPDQDGIGLAVYNRLIRAAGFNIKEV